MNNSSSLAQQNKNILGYVLRNRIGSGGFGEVWSAVAPGGIPKAVKIVFGYHDERRAQEELKALDRVKALRHPFLLSLERIEVCEGQLIVVSELADKSLADLFNEFQLKGESGIPRDVLLKLMRNCADALDYMSSEYGLQHLDVKPENLLLVGNHVKVADFGLIKELNNVTQSLLSGMTPAYGAPEVFDGRPGKFSDQYSLAIVYQEMLTGKRPFAGTTPAQLAAQHVHGKPDLKLLPQSDQAIVAKALAKDPNLRFASCSELVEELSNRKRVTRNSVRRLNPNERSRLKTEAETVVLAHDVDSQSTEIVTSRSLPFQSRSVKVLSPPEVDGFAARFRPLLVVGLGATANKVLAKLKKKLNARHGDLTKIPALRLLAIDTDRNEMTRLSTADSDEALSISETTTIPLMKSEYYRDRSASRLAWMSRRWLYNIPRTLQTEGLRPLGRLAFTEHFELICQKLEESIKQIATAENLAKTADALEMEPGVVKPRVFLLSSISGGIGSGMMLDMAYTIRLLLAEQGFESDALSGILMHSCYERNRDPGLAAANAFALLTELRHFVEYGYPGDESIGMPDFESVPPFDHTYYYELGDNLSQSDFDEQIARIAEYVYLSSASRCSAFFDQCRELDRDKEHFPIRTFGLGSAGPEGRIDGEKFVQILCHSLVSRWKNRKPISQENAKQAIKKVFLDYQISENDALLNIDVASRQLIPESMESSRVQVVKLAYAAPDDLLNQIDKHLNDHLGMVGSQRHPSDREVAGCTKIEEQLGADAVKIADLASESLMQNVEGQWPNLAAAKAIYQAWQNELQSIIGEVTRKYEAGSQQLQMLRTNLNSNSVSRALVSRNEKESEKIDQLLREYADARWQEFRLYYCRYFYRSLANSMAGFYGVLQQFEDGLTYLGSRFSAASISPDLIQEESNCHVNRLLTKAIEDNIEHLLDRTEIAVFESFVKQNGGHLNVLQSSNLTCHCQQSIADNAKRVLADAFQKTSLEDVMAAYDIGPEQIFRWMAEMVNNAALTVDNCGGGSRVLLGLPALTAESILPELLQQKFSLDAQSIKGTRGNFTVCFEGEQLSLAGIAFRLLQTRPDSIELVKRIHTRTDISWSTLNDLF